MAQNAAVPINSNGSVSVAAPTTGIGLAYGQIATASVLTTAVLKNTYTEQTTNAQRSFVSSSANDTSAGTGARTLTLTYLDQNMAGPFTETITMNGTSNVNTSSSTICYIESIVVATVGSNLSPVGTITMKAASGGGGATITTLSAGDNRTIWAQHYVPTGKTCYITDWHSSTLVNASTSGAKSYLTKKPLSLLEIAITGTTHYIGNIGTQQVTYLTPVMVEGPAKILNYITTDANTANTHYADFAYYEIDTPG